MNIFFKLTCLCIVLLFQLAFSYLLFVFLSSRVEKNYDLKKNQFFDLDQIFFDLKKIFVNTTNF